MGITKIELGSKRGVKKLSIPALVHPGLPTCIAGYCVTYFDMNISVTSSPTFSTTYYVGNMSQLYV